MKRGSRFGSNRIRVFGDNFSKRVSSAWTNIYATGKTFKIRVFWGVSQFIAMVILVLAVLKIDNYHRSLLAPVCVYLFSIVLYFVLSLTHLLKITNRCVCYGKELNAQSRHYMVVALTFSESLFTISIGFNMGAVSRLSWGYAISMVILGAYLIRYEDYLLGPAENVKGEISAEDSRVIGPENRSGSECT